MADKALSSKMGRVWVQPGGANQPVYLLNCTDLGDITEPKGSVELIRCFDANGDPQVVGETQSPPDPVTVTITGLLQNERSALEKLEGPFAVYNLMRDGGKADIWANYVRGQLVQRCRISQRTLSGTAAREEDGEATSAFDIEGWPPLIDIDLLDITQLTNALGNVPANGIWANTDKRNQGDQGLPKREPGDEIWLALDSAAGAKPTVAYSLDFGNTIQATAADPFAIDDDATAVTVFYIGRTDKRALVAKKGVAASQGKVAYSDDTGATWTEVNVGGAAAGHGPVMGAGLFALDRTHIWMGSLAGYIYKSTNGGESFTAVEAGAIHAGAYNAIHFADDQYGVAAGAAGVVALSNDGGDNWTAATVPVAEAINACVRLDKTRLWVATATGKLYYSEDEGVTWTQRTGWTGSGTGAIKALAFANEYEGYMLHDNATPVGSVLRTFNGGYDWEVLTTPTNGGLNALAVARGNRALVAGAAVSANPFVAKVDRP